MKVTFQKIGLALKGYSELKYIILFIPFVFCITLLQNYIDNRIFFALILAPVIFILLADVDLVLKIFVATFFISILFAYLSIAVYFASIVLAAILVTQRKITSFDLANPLNKPIFLYTLACLISLINTLTLPGSLFVSINYFLFIALLYFLPICIDNHKKIHSLIALFLALSFLNSVQIIWISALTNKRFFGFGGIMFIDFVNIALLIAIVYSIFKYKSRVLFIALSGIFTIASFLMQTRNAWIAISLTLVVLFAFLFINSDSIGIKKKKVISYLVLFSIIFIVLFYLTASINSSVASRTSDLKSKTETISEGGDVSNSLISRLLIWHTAFNGFKAHPVIGIGWFSFPFSSQSYSTLPKILYIKYVEGVTPHLGYLSVLCETGIIGLLTFIYFLTCVIKGSIRAFKRSEEMDGKMISLIIFSVLVYIAISLCFTDAWLLGRGAMVWGLFIAFSLANNKILQKQ